MSAPTENPTHGSAGPAGHADTVAGQRAALDDGPAPVTAHTLSGAWAVDAVSPQEKALFATHTETCRDCATEADELTETAARLSEVTAVDPPPALRDRVLAEIATVRPLPPAGGVDALAAHPAAVRRWRRRTPQQPASRWSLGLAAAAAVVIGSAGTTFFLDTIEGPRAPVSTAAVDPVSDKTSAVLSAPDAVRRSAVLASGGRVVVVTSRAQGRSVLVADTVTAPDSGVLQLWLIGDNGDSPRYLPAGVVPTDTDSAAVLLPRSASDSSAVGVTVEPDRGARVPTTEPVAVIALGA